MEDFVAHITEQPVPEPLFLMSTSPKIPRGLYSKASEWQVYRLTKSLYDLKQACRQWNKELIVTGLDNKEICKVKSALNEAFMVKDLGQARYFFGVEIARSKKGIRSGEIQTSNWSFALPQLYQTQQNILHPTSQAVHAIAQTAASRRCTTCCQVPKTIFGTRYLLPEKEWPQSPSLLWLGLGIVSDDLQIPHGLLHFPRASANLLIWDFRIVHHLPVILNCNNKVAEHIVANPVFHEWTKHLDINCHIVRNQVQKCFVKTKHVTSREQFADLLTKPLGISAHHRLHYETFDNLIVVVFWFWLLKRQLVVDHGVSFFISSIFISQTLQESIHSFPVFFTFFS